MFQIFISEIQARPINWIAVAKQAGLPRAMFSKHFGAHQLIAEKNYGAIFRAVIAITGALQFDGRIWMLDPDNTGIVLWLSAENWDDQDNRGIMDAHDLRVYLSA